MYHLWDSNKVGHLRKNRGINDPPKDSVCDKIICSSAGSK